MQSERIYLVWAILVMIHCPLMRSISGQWSGKYR